MLATASPILPSAAILKVYEALKSIEIKTILDFKRQSDKQLVSIHEDTSLVLALDQMKSNNILAAPIYRYIKHNDIDGKEDEAGQGILKEYTGIVSVYDCVAQIAFQKVFEAFDPVTGAIKDSSAFKDYLDIWKEEEEAMGISVKEVLGSTFESASTFCLHSKEHLTSLLTMLSTANHHRLLVVDDEALNANGVSFGEEMNSAGDGSQLEQSSSADYTAKQKLDFLEQWRGDDNFKLITQTDLIKFVWDRRYKLGVSKADIDSIFQQTPAMLLSELANMKHPVDEMDPNQSSESGGLAKPKLLVRVPESSTAIAAFRKMWIYRASAVAVVDKQGAIIANLSASDLRGITKMSIEALLLPVYQFLEFGGQTNKHQLAADQLRTASPIHSIGTVIEMMLTSRIHRVWIVDGEDKPIGVVTMSDILSALVPPSPIHETAV